METIECEKCLKSFESMLQLGAHGCFENMEDDEFEKILPKDSPSPTKAGE
jgi:protein-arginine kinase activator protein McsA